MEQLKLAWVYRFWIVVGIVAIMPIISYVVDTRDLAKTAQKQANDLKAQKEQLEKGAQGPNPNDNWAQEVTALKESLYGQVGVAWVDLYKKQLDVMTWPAAVKDEYIAAGEEGVVDVNTRDTYQRLYLAQYNDLFKIVEPLDQKGKGLVQMELNIVEKYVQPWALEVQDPPTVPEAWLAQEDIWLLRALLTVVAQANEGSTKLQESAVKEISEIRIGNDASLDSQAKAKKEQLSPRGNAPPGAAGAPKGAPREIKGTLYRQIPVYMRLIVDQPRLRAVLAEFGNQKIPMQVRQVAFNDIDIAIRHQARLTAMLGSAAKKSDVTQRLGSAPPKDDDFFQMCEIEVWARAIFYNKPLQIQQEEAAIKAAADKAKADQPNVTPAPPAGATN